MSSPGDIRNLGVNRAIHKLEDHEQSIAHVMIRVAITSARTEAGRRRNWHELCREGRPGQQSQAEGL